MKKTSSGFVNHLLVGLLVTISIGGSAGVATVWMRHQISATAQKNRELAAELSRVMRLIDEKDTAIETEQAPDKLRALNFAFQLGLVPMNEVAVHLITENAVERMVANTHREVLTDRAAPPLTLKVARR